MFVDGGGRTPLGFFQGALLPHCAHKANKQAARCAAHLVPPERRSAGERRWRSQADSRRHSALMGEGKSFQQTSVFGRKPQILGFHSLPSRPQAQPRIHCLPPCTPAPQPRAVRARGNPSPVTSIPAWVPGFSLGKEVGPSGVHPGLQDLPPGVPHRGGMWDARPSQDRTAPQRSHQHPHACSSCPWKVPPHHLAWGAPGSRPYTMCKWSDI